MVEGLRDKLALFLGGVRNKAALDRVPELIRKLGGNLVGLLGALGQSVVLKSLLAAISLAGLVGLGVYFTLPRATSQDEAPVVFKVAKGDFTVKLTERGELRALESVTVSAQKDLPIIYLVPEGTRVEKGDVLVRMDASKFEVGLEANIAMLRVAEAQQRKAEKVLESQREKLEAEIARFEAERLVAQLDLDDLKKKPLPGELENARMELERAKLAFAHAEKRRNILPELVERGFVTNEAFEEAELGYLKAKVDLQVAQFNFNKVAAGATLQELERANIRLEQAKFALEKARRGMGMDLQSLEADIETEKANVEKHRRYIDKAQEKLNRMELRAPKEGLVVYASVGKNSSEKIQLGMMPFEGQPLIYLPDLSTMVVDTQINEIDIGKVKLGSPVEVRPEAYPGTVFHGKVYKISSLAKFKQTHAGNASGVKVFDVTALIEGKDPRLKPGLTAVLDIIADRQEDVIFIPVSAVVSRRGQHVVFVSNTGQVEERAVVLGLSNQQYVIVKEGLREGELVVQGAPLLEAA